jgi:cystathionine beta-lyase/cystathionine gamma-synthase
LGNSIVVSWGGYQGFGTAAIHAGQTPDSGSGAVIPVISLATTFVQESPGKHKVNTSIKETKYNSKGFDYSRSGNPTRQQYEDCIAALEKGKYGTPFLITNNNKTSHKDWAFHLVVLPLPQF